MSMQVIKRGDIFKTPKFNEPVRGVNDPGFADGFVILDLLGLRTNTFRGGVIFTETDLQHIEIQPSVASYQGDPKLFKLGLEALRIRLAHKWAIFFSLLIILVNSIMHNQKVPFCAIVPVIRIFCINSNEHPDTRRTGNTYLEFWRQFYEDSSLSLWTSGE